MLAICITCAVACVISLVMFSLYRIDLSYAMEKLSSVDNLLATCKTILNLNQELCDANRALLRENERLSAELESYKNLTYKGEVE